MKLPGQFAPLIMLGMLTGPANAGPPASGGENIMILTRGDVAATGPVPGFHRERYRMNLEYSPATASRWYGFVEGDRENHTATALQTRGVLVSGPGYRLYNGDAGNLSMRGGLSYSDVDLHDARSDRYPGLTWGFNWEQTFFDRHLNFFHRHRGNRGFDSGSSLTINAETGVSVPLTSGLRATARYDLDLDRSERDASGNADHTYTLGLGYDW